MVSIDLSIVWVEKRWNHLPLGCDWAGSSQEVGSDSSTVLVLTRATARFSGKEFSPEMGKFVLLDALCGLVPDFYGVAFCRASSSSLFFIIAHTLSHTLTQDFDGPSGLHRVRAPWTKTCSHWHQVLTPFTLDHPAFGCCNKQHDRLWKAFSWTASGYMTSLLSCCLHVCPSSLRSPSLYYPLVAPQPSLYLKTQSRQFACFVRTLWEETQARSLRRTCHHRRSAIRKVWMPSGFRKKQ